jgi:hypothetical protein
VSLLVAIFLRRGHHKAGLPQTIKRKCVLQGLQHTILPS